MCRSGEAHLRAGFRLSQNSGPDRPSLGPLGLEGQESRGLLGSSIGTGGAGAGFAVLLGCFQLALELLVGLPEIVCLRAQCGHLPVQALHLLALALPVAGLQPGCGAQGSASCIMTDLCQNPSMLV